jgi:PilZ domain
MSERRRLFRNRVYYGGWIAFNARHSTLECVVRDFSPFGVKIEGESLAILPDELEFAVPRKGLKCVARLAWRDRNAAGLVFGDSSEANRVIPMEWARKLRASEQANKQLQARIDRLRSEQ